jgi:membrane associated rhomboid family serine protease/Zn-finger nucleic acid-binding protein
MFTCPHCAKPLESSNGLQGVYWICPLCKGRAASLGVLRKAFGAKRVAAIWNEALNETTAPGCACPICLAAMDDVTWREEAADLTLDLCRRCEFVWFGPGKFDAIAPAPPKPRALGDIDVRSLPMEAREALAMAKVQQIAKDAQDLGDSPEEGWKAVPAVLGFPVELDPDYLSRAPVATYLLSALIFMVSLWAFLLQRSSHEDVAAMLGLVPADPWRLHGFTFVSSFFLHGSWFHLIGNLYFLIVFGRHVEAYLGAWRWLLVVACAAVMGDVVDILCTSSSTLPLIGASGGISGLLAFYALKFPHARLSFFFVLRWVTIPAWAALLCWLGLQFLGAYEQLHQVGNVASLAHLGGVIAGVAFWHLWKNLDAQPMVNSKYPRIQIRS